MYKKGDELQTIRGDAYIVATKTEYHIINGAHPILNSGDKLYPSGSKDYVVAFKNFDKNSSLEYVYEHLTQLELDSLIVK